LKMKTQRTLRLASLFCCTALAGGMILQHPEVGYTQESRWKNFKKHAFPYAEYPSKPDPMAVKESWLNSSEFLYKTRESRIKISLVEYLNVIQRRNEKILFQELEKKIVGSSTLNAQSIYDPEVTVSIDRESIRELNSTEESLARSSLTEYIDKTNTVKAGIEGLVPSGARIKLDYSFEDEVNNLQTPALSGGEISTAIGLSVTQPLLKNFGSKVVNANIHIAKEDQEIAEQTYRQTLMEVIFNGVQAYLDQQLAQEKHKARQESVQLAEEILTDNKRQFELGQMAETEVLEAQAGLAQRRSSELVARQDVSTAENAMRQLLLLSVAQNRLGLEVIDELAEVKPYKSDVTKSLRLAFEKQPEYLARKIKIAREGIRVDYAENQMLPKLDLKAGITMNGFGKTTTNSLNTALHDEYNTWNIGAEFSIPIGGMKSKSEFSAARFREKQALLDLHAIEVAITNNIDVSVRMIDNAYNQWRQSRLVVESRAQLMEKERNSLQAGKSNSRLILEREESLIEAKDMALDKNVAFQKALLGVYLAEGTLLEKYGIEQGDKEEEAKPHNIATLEQNLSPTEAKTKPAGIQDQIIAVRLNNEQEESVELSVVGEQPEAATEPEAVTEPDDIVLVEQDQSLPEEQELTTSTMEQDVKEVPVSETALNSVVEVLPDQTIPEKLDIEQTSGTISHNVENLPISNTVSENLDDLHITDLLDKAWADFVAQRLTRGFNGNALEKFKQVLELDPDNQKAKEGLLRISDMLSVMAADNIANMQLTLPPGDNALDRYRLALELNPDNTDAKAGLVHVAGKLVESAKIDLQELRLSAPPGRNALEKFRKAYSLDGNNLLAKQGVEQVRERYLDLGQRAVQRQDWQRAARFLERAVQEFPEDTGIFDALEALHQQMSPNKLAEGSRLDKDGVEPVDNGKPTKPQERPTAPVLQVEKHEREEAAEQTVKHGQNPVETLLAQAKVDIASKRLTRGFYGNAMEKFRKVLELDSDNIQAKEGLLGISSKLSEMAADNMANMQLTLPPGDNALDRYRLALELNPDNTDAQTGLIQISGKLVESAQIDLQELRLSAPSGRNALEKFRKAYSLDKNNLLAQQGVEQIRQRYLYLGQRAMQRQDWPRATRFLERAIQEFPADVRIIDAFELLQQQRPPLG
jgi:outer membrane protein TolC/Tfp pilus assembly protein PilF